MTTTKPQHGLPTLLKRQFRQEQAGYSLIELVIYIALFAMLSIVLVNSLVTVLRTTATAQRYRALQNNGELVMERITREIRTGSTATTSGCSTTLGTLSIASTDTSAVAHTTVFSVASGVVQFATDGAAPSSISTNEVAATALTLCPMTTPVSTAVKTKLVLTTVGVNPVTAAFYATTVLRGK